MSDSFTLELNKYERDNLIALLKIVRSGKAGPLDTGDWCGQIYFKLAGRGGFDPDEHVPNIPPDIQIDMVERAWAARLGVKR